MKNTIGKFTLALVCTLGVMSVSSVAQAYHGCCHGYYKPTCQYSTRICGCLNRCTGLYTYTYCKPSCYGSCVKPCVVVRPTCNVCR